MKQYFFLVATEGSDGAVFPRRIFLNEDAAKNYIRKRKCEVALYKQEISHSASLQYVKTFYPNEKVL